MTFQAREGRRGRPSNWPGALLYGCGVLLEKAIRQLAYFV